MQLELVRAPPNTNVVVVQQHLAEGRYTITQDSLVEIFDSEQELTAWLEYSNMIQMLIRMILRDLKVYGICTLSSKGMVITDTEWQRPTNKIDWSAFKQA